MHLTPRLQQLVRTLAQRWDESPQPVFAHDSEARRIYSNPAFDQLVGYPGSELMGRKPPHPYWEKRAEGRMLEACQATLDGRLRGLGIRSVGGTFRSAAGRVFDVLVSGGEVRDRGELIAMVLFVFEIPSEGAAESSILVGLDSILVELRQQTTMLEARPLSPSHGEPRLSLPGWERLTARERQVARWIGDGARVTTIARELGVSAHTVRNHLKSVFRKTGMRSQEDLVLALQRLKLPG